MNKDQLTRPEPAGSDEIDSRLQETGVISVRISPNSYLAAIFVASFVTTLLFYLWFDIAAFSTFVISWIFIPLLALRDRVCFDGKFLYRTGLLPRAFAAINGTRRRLRLSDIDHVETESVRTIKRAGNIYYRHRTTFRGKGLAITIASGGEEYRTLVRSILPKLADAILDTRSIEIRDHLSDPKEALMRAEFSKIPSADVLSDGFRVSERRSFGSTVKPADTADADADELRGLANQLRLSGYLAQALEAFRRALIIRPRDSWLLFEFARCLHSFAGVEKDPKLQRRALAASRLLERRATNDAELLTRLGEWYFQIGEWGRAGTVFRNTLERLGDNFHAARGLAELALREGKLAHVIHHFATASRVAATPSLRRWSKQEAEYFSNLHTDDEYMELEVSRVNMLETVERSKRTSLRISFMAFPLIVTGILFEDALVAEIGWAVASVALLIWSALIITGRMLARRLPYDVLHSSD